jgi:hypothetical protein
MNLKFFHHFRQIFFVVIFAKMLVIFDKNLENVNNVNYILQNFIRFFILVLTLVREQDAI